MRLRPRTVAASIGPALLGAAYSLALVAYEHRGVVVTPPALSLALAWALPCGLALGAAAGALGRMRGSIRREGRGLWGQSTLLLLGGWHLTAGLWALAARPALASPDWYARGGLRRLTQVLASDVLGPRAIVAIGLGAALVYALGGPSVLRTLVAGSLGRRARVRRPAAPPKPGARAARSGRRAGAALLGLAALALTVLVRPGRSRPPAVAPSLVLVGFGALDGTPVDARTTPALEALARESVVFDQALVSTTDPALGRAVWLSGLEPYQLRAAGEAAGGAANGPVGSRAERTSPAGPPDRPGGTRSERTDTENTGSTPGEPVASLPQRLAKFGYRSALVGDGALARRWGLHEPEAPALERWPLALEPLRLLATRLAPPLGLDAPGRRDLGDAGESVERALRFVDAGAGPFALTLFLPGSRPPLAGACPRALAFAEPSYRGRCKYRACDVGPGSPPLDDADRRQENALRRGALACDDEALGRLLEGLRERGLEGTTLVAAFGERAATAPRVEGEAAKAAPGGEGEAAKAAPGDEGEAATREPRPGGEATTIPLDDRTLRTLLLVRQGRAWAPARRGEMVRDVDLAPTLDELLGLAPVEGSPGRSLAGALRGGPAVEASAFAEADVGGDRGRVGALGRRWALSEGRHRLVAQATRRGLAVELFDRVADPLQERDRSAEMPALRDTMRDALLRLVLRERALQWRFDHVMPRPGPASWRERPLAPGGEEHERQYSLLDALQGAEQEGGGAISLRPGAALSTLAADPWAPPHPSRRRVTVGAAGERVETRDAFVVPTPSTLRLPLRPGRRARLRVAPAPLSPPEAPFRVEVRARRHGAPPESLAAFELGVTEAGRWVEREVDLGRFAGDAIELELRAVSEAAEGPAIAWGSPALVEASTPELPYNVVLVALTGASAERALAPGGGLAAAGPAGAEAAGAPFDFGPVAARGFTFPDFVPAATWREPELLALLSGLRSGELGLDVGGPPPSKASLDAFYARRPPLLAPLLEQRGATTLALHEASAGGGGPLGLDLGFDTVVERLERGPPARSANVAALGPREHVTSAAEIGAWLERHRRERFFVLALLDGNASEATRGGPREAINALLAPLQKLGLERETIVAIVPTSGSPGPGPDAPERFLSRPAPLVVIPPGGEARPSAADGEDRPSAPGGAGHPPASDGEGPPPASDREGRPPAHGGKGPPPDPRGDTPLRAEVPVHSTDLAPTLLALERLASDARVSGRALLDARQTLTPAEALGGRPRLIEGRGGRALRSGPWLYVERDARTATKVEPDAAGSTSRRRQATGAAQVERDAAGLAQAARSFLFDARSPRPRDVAGEQPEAAERARDELARALSRHRSPEAHQSEALAGSRFEPPPPSPRASVKLRFYGGGARRRVALRIEKPARGPGEIAPSLRVTPVGLDPGVLYEGPSFVDAAFFTRADLAPGFDLELAPSTTPLGWHLSWNDGPLEPSNWLAGPYGLSLPALRDGLLDEGTRRFAEGLAPPADLAPGSDEGVLVLWSELPDPGLGRNRVQCRQVARWIKKPDRF